MKKIIEQKMYNTDTATYIGNNSNNFSRKDFHYFSEDLYRKTTGEFFLFGEGHALSAYRGQYGDSWGWGEAIVPLTEDEAKNWVRNT